MKTIRLEMRVAAGRRFDDVAKEAIAMAKEKKAKIVFEFNEIDIEAVSASTPEDLWAEHQTKSQKAHEEYLKSDKYKEYCKAEDEKRLKQDRDFGAMIDRLPHMNESELAELKPPRSPRTQEEVLAIVNALATRMHDYGTCCYAMSLSAWAAFQYVAGHLGVTGFQASIADLDFIKRSRHIDSPFALLTAEKILYPQYDLHSQLDEWIVKWKPWAAEEARKKLMASQNAAPTVVEHWKRLSAEHPPKEKK